MKGASCLGWPPSASWCATRRARPSLRSASRRSPTAWAKTGSPSSSGTCRRRRARSKPLYPDPPPAKPQSDDSDMSQGDMSQPRLPNIDVERLRAQHLLMHRIRALEEVALRALDDKLVLGAIHPSIGQEAVAAGIIAHLAPRDLLLST